MLAADRLLARRYAKALFEAVSAVQGGDGRKAAGEGLEEAARALTAAAAAASANAAALSHPSVPAARKKALLREGAGPGASPRALRLLDVLVEKKRAGLLPAVSVEFGRLVDDARGVARAQARCAADLSAQESDRLRRALEKLSGKQVAIAAQPAPELLGGVVVRMGDWVLDGSIQGSLRRLRDHLARES